MKILVVEDEKLVQDYIRKILGGVHADATIEMVDNGDEGLKRYLASGPYDLVVTDYAHPGLFADQLVEAIRARNSAQRIILQTGNWGPHIEEFRRRWPDITYLEKPYRKQQLQDLVRQPPQRS